MLQEKGAAQADAEALQQARSELFGMVQELMSSRKLRDRKRSARILGQSSSKPGATPLRGAAEAAEPGRSNVVKRSQDLQPTKEIASNWSPLVGVDRGDMPVPTFRLARWDDPSPAGGGE